ncbi:MAG: class I SAM-dependent rRNA methyltransferase, partial [Bacteroidales bacterium]
MSQALKIILRSGKDDPLRRFHPWVFSGAIKKTEGRAYDGCLAEVFSNKDEYLGSGIYQDAAIAVRIMAFAPERPDSFDTDFWEKKIRRAFDLRKLTGLTDNPHTNVYRLIHGEGDHLPGLIIDHYDGHLVIQIHSTGLYAYIEQIAGALKKVYGNKLRSVFDKSKETLPAVFWDTRAPKASLYGETRQTEVQE